MLFLKTNFRNYFETCYIFFFELKNVPFYFNRQRAKKHSIEKATNINLPKTI